MPFNPHNSTINQHLQFGAESTSNLGVNVAANKLILCYDIQWGPMADIKMYEGTGRKYPSSQIENSEWVERTLAGKHFNYYLDTSSATLGTTQLLNAVSVDYGFTGIYGPYFPFNRANLGWTAHVDLNPGCIFKLMVEADSVGMGILSNMQTGSTL